MTITLAALRQSGDGTYLLDVARGVKASTLSVEMPREGDATERLHRFECGLRTAGNVCPAGMSVAQS